jgi:hypothetical protein
MLNLFEPAVERAAGNARKARTNPPYFKALVTTSSNENGAEFKLSSSRPSEFCQRHY